MFARTFEAAMRIGRECFLGPGHQAHTTGAIDTPAGTVGVAVPKTAGRDGAPFFPQPPEWRLPLGACDNAGGRRYVRDGGLDRQVEAVLCEFGIEGVSSSRVDRAATARNDEREAWWTRPLAGNDGEPAFGVTPFARRSLPFVRRVIGHGVW